MSRSSGGEGDSGRRFHVLMNGEGRKELKKGCASSVIDKRGRKGAVEGGGGNGTTDDAVSYVNRSVVE